MDEHDAFLTEHELSVLMLLEYLYDNGGRDEPSDLRDLGIPSDDLPGLVRAADATGYVTTYRDHMSAADTFPPVLLNTFGVRYVDDLRRARSDRITRARGCRNAAIRWVYENGSQHVTPGDMLNANPPRLFFGSAFTEDEVNAASKYLVDAGLFEGPGTWQANGALVLASLTARGVQCAEDFDGDVRVYLNRHEAAGPAQVTFTQNFNAAVTGQVAQGQSVQQVQHGIDDEAIARIFETMLQAAQDIQDVDDRADLQEAIASLRHAATSDSPDPVEVERRAGFLRRQASRVGATALTVAATKGTTELLHLMGGAIS